LDRLQIERIYDAKHAEMANDVRTSDRIRSLRRRARIVSAILVIGFIVSNVVGYFALQMLFAENRSNSRLTGAAVIGLAVNFSIVTMVFSQFLRRLFGGRLRRWLSATLILQVVLASAAFGLLYSGLIHASATGAANALWVGPVVILAGTWMGWTGTYQYRHSRVALLRMLGRTDRLMVKAREASILSEVSIQNSREAMHAWRAQDEERERMAAMLRVMRG
jgi:hypothetical protein